MRNQFIPELVTSSVRPSHIWTYDITAFMPRVLNISLTPSRTTQWAPSWERVRSLGRDGFNQTLTHVNLQSNGIGDDGARHLADAFKKNSVSFAVSKESFEKSSQLQSDSHQFEPSSERNRRQGCYIFCRRFEEQRGEFCREEPVHLRACHFFNQTLTHLDLQNSGIHAEGARHLADAFNNNSVSSVVRTSSLSRLWHLQSDNHTFEPERESIRCQRCSISRRRFQLQFSEFHCEQSAPSGGHITSSNRHSYI